MDRAPAVEVGKARGHLARYQQHLRLVKAIWPDSCQDVGTRSVIMPRLHEPQLVVENKGGVQGGEVGMCKLAHGMNFSAHANQSTVLSFEIDALDSYGRG